MDNLLTSASQKKRIPWPSVFSLWLVVFYVAWFCLIIQFGNLLEVASHWLVSLAMAGGSFVAGSSPIAGGTVGFPMMVFVSNESPNLGKSFCLAIQSIGMVSASIYIVTNRRPVDWGVLRLAMIGSAIALPCSMIALVPTLDDAVIKIVFAVLYGVFGLLHLIQMRRIVNNKVSAITLRGVDSLLIVATGAMGGMIAAVLGVGADICLYGMLVLFFKCDVKVAIPTATILMAFNSLVGIATLSTMSTYNPIAWASLTEIYPYWLAAAPIVVLGGPLGSMISKRVPRIVILSGVAFLCTFQCIWTCSIGQITGWHLAIVLIVIVAVNVGLYFRFLKTALPVSLKTW
jgi:uncharacterized protein